MNRNTLVVLLAGLLVACMLLCFCVAVGGVFAYSYTVAQQPTDATPIVVRPTPRATVAPDDPVRPTATREVGFPDPTPTVVVSSTTADETLAAIQAEVLPQRDLFELAQRYALIPADSPRVVRESDPGYQLGERLTFSVSDQEGTVLNATAELRAQTEHASWWVEEGYEVDQNDLEASARIFEERSYPTNRAAFGSEWSPGVDGDLRVHIFLGNVPGVGGYYSSADEFPRSVIETSNEKEIFYINLENAEPGNSYFDGILAHEFQHMIHWNVDRNEELWINEGLSELAAYINGFDVDSAARSFTRQPDLPVTRWSEQTYPFYGSAFLFLLYFQERFGDEAIRELVAEPLDGPAAFEAVMASRGGMSFDELYADWMIALLLDDGTVAQGHFGFEGEDPGTLDDAFSTFTYPATESGRVNQYGIDRLDFRASSGPTTLTVRFDGDDYSALLPIAPHSGEWVLWGNRGDDSHATAHRSLDLTGVTGAAEMTFWTWYALESDYDYAYVTASTDGGVTWTALESAAMTRSDPNGNSFGPAFTGGSDGWIQQSVDLSAFTGQQVMIAFEVVTDDALNEPGFLVDDIEVPQIGYRDDFENAALPGWTTQGFVRVGETLPQEWIVRAVSYGEGGMMVESFELDSQGTGSLTIGDFGGTVEQVTLLVSAATHPATAPGTYRFEAAIEP